MWALSNREIGQLAFAFAAISLNFAVSIPGTFAVSVRSEAVTDQPADGTFSRFTAAVASRRSGLYPASPRAAERAIAKQPACAAATSSSGFVPAPDSKRELNE